MASFSVKNRVAMFEKPSVDTEPEVSKNIVSLKSPVSPATSYLSSHSHKSNRSSPLGGGPYSSVKSSPRHKETSGAASPRKTPRQAMTPKKASTPRKSITPRRMQHTKSASKISSPFLVGNTQTSKPVVLPSKSNTAPPGWATDNLRSSGLVSRSPFKKTVGTQESEEVHESRDVSWSTKKEVTETRDGALLKNSLNAAQVVLEEEKSSAGSSNASSRSSLSTKELSDIAKRALTIAKKKSVSPKTQQNLGPAVLPAPSMSRGAAHVPTKPTPGQAWKAAMEPMKKSHPLSVPSKEKTVLPAPVSLNPVLPSPGAGRAKNRAAAVAAAKKTRSKTGSTASSADARRALLANAKKNKERKEEVAKQLTSKQDVGDVEVAARLGMKASRVLAMKNSFQKSEHSRDDTSSVASFESNRSRRVDHPAFAARAMAPSPKPKHPDGNDEEKPFSAELISSFRHFSAARTEKDQKKLDTSSAENDGRPPTPKTLRAAVLGAKAKSKSSLHTREDASMDDSFVEQEDSLHSMSGRNYFTHQEEGAYLSSLSGSNTFSMMSSMNDQFTPSNTAFKKYGMESAMSPGPSMRSGHSMAQSMISTTPTAHSTARNTNFDHLLKTPSASKTSVADAMDVVIAEEKDASESIRSGDSKRRSTSSPPGFILEEGVKKVVGAETSVEDFFGDDFFQGIEDGSVKDEAPEDDEKLLDQGPQTSEGSQSARDTSTSTKDSINTSIRTGLSSIQNEVPENGSKSMRSGLSGIFPEASQHPSVHQSRRGLPDTIREEEEKEAASVITSGSGAQTNQDDRDTIFDGTSANQSQANTPKDTNTEPADTVFEGVSHASSKKSGGWWKGKKVKSKIRTALSKKSTQGIPADDDIFGGLEDEKTSPDEKKQRGTGGRKPKDLIRHEKKARGAEISVDAKPLTPEKEPTQNEKSIHSTNDRSGTNVEYEEIDDVESEITTSILGDNKKHLAAAAAAEAKAKTTDILFIEQKDVKSEPTPVAEKETVSSGDQLKESETNHARCRDGPGSIFLNLGCGIGDMLDGGFCNYGSTAPTPKGDVSNVNTGTSSDVAGSPGSLSAREEQVWKEWENRDSSMTNEDNNSSHNKKREEAHGKLLDIANSALSGMNEDGDAISPEDTEASTSRNGNLDHVGATEAANSSTKAPTVETKGIKREDTRHSRYSALSASTPMTLSNNQRSLVEKFSKHLSNDGVEVMKLNTKKQWQVRFFTISKEQVALTAHEALKPSGDVAQCPKALLWVKKFSAKGIYGISNIDKLGHGGMMLASLVNVQVIPKVENKHLIPKKMQEKFKKAVIVTLDYNFDGAEKSVEFLCTDNDQAQFLCTCIRVSRDLLKREETLRQRLKEI